MERAVNFPQGVPYGTTHFEHGRTFEYVAPGMWKSIGGSGGGGGIDDAPSDGLIYARQDGQWVQITSGGGGSGPTDWADILNKPQPIKDLAAENAPKVSIVSGGSY
jgi:hypothetical protein